MKRILSKEEKKQLELLKHTHFGFDNIEKDKIYEFKLAPKGYGKSKFLIEKTVSQYIKECFINAYEEGEDPKELERFIIIDPFYASYSPFLSDEENIKQAKWFHRLNEELIKQMTAKGYKYCWCEEDIEFYK